MQIVTVGPGITYRYAKFFYATDRKIRNGLVRSGHHVTHVSDRDVASSALGVRPLGKGLANRKLLEVVEAVEPDLIILFQAHLITKETLSSIKAKINGCKIANFDNDPLISEKHFERLWDLKDVVEATFTTSAGEPLEQLRKGGLRTSYIPNCTDQSIEDGDPFDNSGLLYDLVYFAGAELHTERWQLPLEFSSIASEVKCGFFGYGKTKVYGKSYFDLLRKAKLALNWSGLNNVHLYTSDRIAQLFGTGRCVCLHKGFGYQRFIGNNDAIYFEDVRDLVAKVRTVLKEDSWQEIGKNGQKRYRDLFNEKRTAQYVVDFTFGEDVSDYEWGSV